MVDKQDLPWNNAKPWVDKANMNTKRGFGAGKGDAPRESDVPKEVYDLNYDLAFGKITREEFDAKLKELGL